MCCCYELCAGSSVGKGLLDLLLLQAPTCPCALYCQGKEHDGWYLHSQVTQVYCVHTYMLLLLSQAPNHPGTIFSGVLSRCCFAMMYVHMC
jgi:hypothetical protein